MLGGEWLSLGIHIIFQIMVYRFTIISDEVDGFMREIKIDANATFLDFHKLILEACGYKDDQMTSFTICENGWEKGEEILLMDMGNEDAHIMAETELADYLEDEKQHLLYTFDPLADRVFFIELSKIITGKHLDKGEVSRSLGEAPSQIIDFDQMFDEKTLAEDNSSIFDDEDADFYGNEISSEEIESEGYDFADDY